MRLDEIYPENSVDGAHRRPAQAGLARSLTQGEYPVDPWVRVKDSNPGLYEQLMGKPECDDLFRFVMGDEEGGIKSTSAFIVIKSGKILFDSYDKQMRPDTVHRLWSGSKIITDLIVATAVRENKISLDDRLEKYYPAAVWRINDAHQDLYKKITLRDLLQMQSGFEWQELETQDVTELSVVKLFASHAAADTVRYALSRPLLPDQYGVFNYSTGDYTILMGVLRQAYGADYDSLPWKNLFDPLGMKNAVFEKDAAGNFVGGALAFLAPTDLAKIGQLLIDDGVYGKKRILPEGWVEMMKQPLPGQKDARFGGSRLKNVGAMGTLLWTNAEYPEFPEVHKAFPNWPDDVLMSIGFLGQTVTVVPSLKMVVVRMGLDIRYGSKIDTFGQKLFQCVGKDVEP